MTRLKKVLADGVAEVPFRENLQGEPLDAMSEDELQRVVKGLATKAIEGNAQAGQAYVKCREYLDKKYGSNRETELTAEEISRIGRKVIAELRRQSMPMAEVPAFTNLFSDDIRDDKG